MTALLFALWIMVATPTITGIYQGTIFASPPSVRLQQMAIFMTLILTPMPWKPSLVGEDTQVENVGPETPTKFDYTSPDTARPISLVPDAPFRQWATQDVPGRHR